MTTTLRTTTKRVPMDSMRKTALVAGIFYLITWLESHGPSGASGVRHRSLMGARRGLIGPLRQNVLAT